MMDYLEARAELRATTSYLNYYVREIERLLSIMDGAREKEVSTCNNELCRTCNEWMKNK